MKKLFLLSILIFTFTIGNAQDSLVVKSVIPPTVADQVNQVVDNVSNKVVALAEALKVPAEKVFIVMVKQQTMNAISDAIFICIFFVLFLLGVIGLFRKDSYKYNSYYDQTGFSANGYVALIMSIVFGLIFMIFSLCESSDVIMGLFNPEYGAIQDIIEMIK